MKHLSLAFVVVAAALAGCGGGEKVKITDVVVGTGPAAAAGSTLDVYYTGKLRNGIVFDSNEDKKTPFTFQLGMGKVIPGWDQGLLGVKAGGERNLDIPSSLAYGSEGQGVLIPPNSDLLFHVKVVAVR